jgi:hypothetical protein
MAHWWLNGVYVPCIDDSSGTIINSLIIGGHGILTMETSMRFSSRRKTLWGIASAHSKSLRYVSTLCYRTTQIST